MFLLGFSLKPITSHVFNDPAKDTTDYDALGWPTKIDQDGRFRLQITDLVPDDFELHMRVFADNGRHRKFEYKYSVDQAGKADTSEIKVEP